MKTEDEKFKLTMPFGVFGGPDGWKPNTLLPFTEEEQRAHNERHGYPMSGSTRGDELTALRAFVREVSQQDPAQVPGQRQSNKERAEDLCEQWGIE